MGICRVAAVAALVMGMQMPSLARAQAQPVTTRVGISGVTLDWIALYGAIDPILNPTASVPGTVGPLKVTVSGPGAESVFRQGTTWGGIFAFGDPVLFSGDAGNTLTLAFSSDIFAIGANIQSNYYGSFSGTVRAYDASNTLVGSYSAGGQYNGNENGLAPFVGLESTTGIRKVTFDVSGNLIDPNTNAPNLSLGINQAVISTSPRTTVPEPGSVFLTGTGIGGVLLLSLRRRRLNA